MLCSLTRSRTIYTSTSRTMSTAPKVPFSALPLAPTLLQHSLTRIPLPSEPSHQRRSKTFPTGHWARVQPLPIAFPYRIPRAEDPEKQLGIEEYLATYEVLDAEPGDGVGVGLKRTEAREEWEAELIGLSRGCLEDCLPDLDVGNAQNSGVRDESFDEVAKELVDVVSGRAVLSGLVEDREGGKQYGPWSIRYAGHQFGSWAGQLGDGRATSLYETQSGTGSRQEIQLKGAGRTPFSRSADGLAVLRSGVREFLGAEAMAALHIPTSRCLTIITHPPSQLQVMREYGPEPSSIVSRLAPSWLRIGSFEAMNPPAAALNTQFVMLGLGGGTGARVERDWEGLRMLGEWCVHGLGMVEEKKAEKGWGLELIREVGSRNMRMVAGWQVYGFCHGVINTDNVSVLGLTIDYGPFAFMDIYDPYHICNHSDDQGRYDYRKQPTMILFAIHSLYSSLAEVIGYEAIHGKPPGAGWAEGVDEVTLEEWRVKGEEGWKEVEREVMGVFKKEYVEGFKRRFGLKQDNPEDLDGIVSPFLQLLSDHSIDFHSSFRSLCNFKPSMLSNTSALDCFLDELCQTSKDPTERRPEAKAAIKPWLQSYAHRIGEEEQDEEERSREMKGHNPRFVLRQWVLEELIKKLENGVAGERRKELERILEMAANPFREYNEDEEEMRLCGMGDKEMLGFQCSCSS